MAGKGTRGTGGAGERRGDGTAHRKVYRAPRAVTVPADLARALAGHRAANARFAALPPSHRREYIGYIEEAKKPETRARRIAKTVAALAERT